MSSVQSFHANVIHLCHYVLDANTTTDLETLKAKAQIILNELNPKYLNTFKANVVAAADDDGSDLI